MRQTSSRAARRIVLHDGDNLRAAPAPRQPWGLTRHSQNSGHGWMFTDTLQGFNHVGIGQFGSLLFGEQNDVIQAENALERSFAVHHWQPANSLRAHSPERDMNVVLWRAIKQFWKRHVFYQRLAGL